jgi:hypothetical protein
MNEPSESSYPQRGRPGLEQADVDRAADALLRKGLRPSVEKVRAQVGGSPNTIAPLLDRWWARLAGRLEAGSDAVARIPGSVAHAAEALFIRALDAARERAEQEQHRDREAIVQDQQILAARRHVLSLREAELDQRLTERDRMVEVLKETLRYERGERRKLEAAYEALQARLRQFERQSTPPQRRPKRKTARATKLPGRGGAARGRKSAGVSRSARGRR